MYLSTEQTSYLTDMTLKSEQRTFEANQRVSQTSLNLGKWGSPQKLVDRALANLMALHLLCDVDASIFRRVRDIEASENTRKQAHRRFSLKES